MTGGEINGPPLTVTVPEQRRDGPAPELDRYELRGLLGAGGMGKVYKALDTLLGREVAIKVVTQADPRDEARLLSEARALAQVRHPNVVPIYDVGVAARDVYIVMPMVAGGTLRTWLDDGKPWRAIVTTFIAAGRGLVAAHDVGLVHRDFKPDNVLLSGSDVLVADFGLARLPVRPALDAPESFAPMITRHDELAGTPLYMAPEQLACEPLDPRCDQFAFAVALWEALYGCHPFVVGEGDRSPRARLDRIAKGPSGGVMTRAPADLEPVLRRALAVRADERWPSLTELLDALEVSGRPRRRWVALPLGLAGVAAVALAAFVSLASTSAETITFADKPYLVGTRASATITETARFDDDGSSQQYHFEASLVVLAAIEGQIVRARMTFGDCGSRRTSGDGNVVDELAPAANKSYVVAFDHDRVDVTNEAHQRVPAAEEQWVQRQAIGAGLGREEGHAVQMPSGPIRRGEDSPIVAEALRHEFERSSDVDRFAATATLVDIVTDGGTQVGVFEFSFSEDKRTDHGVISADLAGTVWKRAVDSRTLRMIAEGHGTQDGRRVTEKHELVFAYDDP